MRKPIRARLAEPERAPQRGRLGLRQRLDERQHRPEQPVQAREGELGLRLDPACHEHLHVGRPVASVGEQRRLADARAAPQHERAAP